jgi:hypothetical protein
MDAPPINEMLDITTENGIIKAYYDPDYKQGCENCGQKPTVRIRKQNGQVFYHGSLCGVCTWGDADAFDPDNW